MEKSEKHCEKMCNENMFNSVKQVSAIENFNKHLDKQGSLPDEPENRMVKDIIVMLSTKRNQATAAQKQKISLTEKCSDAEKRMVLFAEKIGAQNTQFPQRS
eukprot:11174068-Ditylum_brightwellii.AAC.1